MQYEWLTFMTDLRECWIHLSINSIHVTSKWIFNWQIPCFDCVCFDIFIYIYNVAIRGIIQFFRCTTCCNKSQSRGITVNFCHIKGFSYHLRFCIFFEQPFLAKLCKWLTEDELENFRNIERIFQLNILFITLICVHMDGWRWSIKVW